MNYMEKYYPALCLTSITTLNEFVNHIYLNYNVNMKLSMPGLEPLSIIEKSDRQIYSLLEKNVFEILKKLNNCEEIPLEETEYKKFFGFSKREFDIASAIILKVESLKGKNDLCSRERNIIKFADNTLEHIISRIVMVHMTEFLKLFQDFEDNKFTSSEERVSAKYFIITDKDGNRKYLTIGEAVRRNEELKKVKK